MSEWTSSRASRWSGRSYRAPSARGSSSATPSRAAGTDAPTSGVGPSNSTFPGGGAGHLDAVSGTGAQQYWGVSPANATFPGGGGGGGYLGAVPGTGAHQYGGFSPAYATFSGGGGGGGYLGAVPGTSARQYGGVSPANATFPGGGGGGGGGYLGAVPGTGPQQYGGVSPAHAMVPGGGGGGGGGYLGAVPGTGAQQYGGVSPADAMVPGGGAGGGYFGAVPGIPRFGSGGGQTSFGGGWGSGGLGAPPGSRRFGDGVGGQGAVGGGWGGGGPGAVPARRNPAGSATAPLHLRKEIPSTVASTDRDVLMVLYSWTDGPGWMNKTNWGSRAPLSEWHGVTVNAQGRVVELNLTLNNLRGNIPPQLGQLGALELLHLSNNKLDGSIPPDLGKLAALEELMLGGNDLSGAIPPELGDLRELRELWLNGNQLTGSIPPELGKLASLPSLDLSFNHLTGAIPPELGNMAALQTLNLGWNRLSGSIPPELGKLASLQFLNLWFNQLTGPIPAELANLSALEQLSLGNNQLSGDIPPELGDLRELQQLWLDNNQLTGHISPQLGQLGALESLSLANNKLDGRIPKELGKLTALRELALSRNQLSGPVPSELGKLGALEFLDLQSNQLSGSIAPELGKLASLQVLNLTFNQLTGSIPPELGNLIALKDLYLGSNQLSGTIPPELGDLRELRQLWLDNNQLTGGPRKEESLLAWRTRLQSELAEQERAEQVSAEQSRADERTGLERAGIDAAPFGHSSSSAGGDSETVLREQVASFPHLDGLSLEGVKRLLGQPAVANTLSPVTELASKLEELDSLMKMKKILSEMMWRYTADLEIQRKEISLDPGRKAYNVAVRSGLCNAYLAASVVCSGLVSTSKVGVMGKAGTALELISGLVPLVGGLAGFAGAALKAGDCFIQTRRLEKITDCAPDAVECAKLAKSLALRLTDGLIDGTVTYDANEQLAHRSAGVGWAEGGCTSSLDSGAFTEEMDEEVVLEWFIEKVASYECSNRGETKQIREVQAWRQLGERHLRKLLTAVGQGCLQGTSSVEEKVNLLVLVILPEADIPSSETPNAPEGTIVRPPVSAPSHDGQVQQLTTELKELKSKVLMVEKRLPESHGRLGGSVDAGGGFLFSQERKTETLEEFNERMENPARATDWQHDTPGELRVVQAHVEELYGEIATLMARIDALEGPGKRRRNRFGWRGNR